MTRNIESIPEMLTTEIWQARQQAIEFQTENGFAIIRLCDIDESISMMGTKQNFVVRDPHGYELEIMVEISDKVAAELERRSRGRITLASSFWINCAERRLAEYLFDNDDYPPNASLTINEPNLDDINLAVRWTKEF